jgi:hypothetical protein
MPVKQQVEDCRTKQVNVLTSYDNSLFSLRLVV